jgi:hypothetical protein
VPGKSGNRMDALSAATRSFGFKRNLRSRIGAGSNCSPENLRSDACFPEMGAGPPVGTGDP